MWMENMKEERVRSLIEEQLGEFRHFAGLPAAEIEAMALRITRAIGSYLDEHCDTCSQLHQTAA
jgi:hypothetical protein